MSQVINLLEVGLLEQQFEIARDELASALQVELEQAKVMP